MGHVIAWLLVGLIAGALAGRVVEGRGLGLLGDMVVGLVGAVIGGLILHAITRSDVAGSFVGECVVAFVGACLLLGLVRALRRGSGGGRGATATFGR
ncbi:MAG TPA: GlsB/YeaQ/YmgE family stress response membrane protein [Candidatus Dormibacteraeota bacterium]|jgi:uncharacterized membrane protein YeaQ/YmgE (transglycosylase-associated protein family)